MPGQKKFIGDTMVAFDLLFHDFVLSRIMPEAPVTNVEV
jgi:hypothetical protein